MIELKCNKCNASFEELTNDGKYLKRINPIGVSGIFICAPDCSYKSTDSDNHNKALLMALEANIPINNLDG